jgi:hypothetical protein
MTQRLNVAEFAQEGDQIILESKNPTRQPEYIRPSSWNKGDRIVLPFRTLGSVPPFSKLLRVPSRPHVTLLLTLGRVLPFLFRRVERTPIAISS